MQIFSRLEGNDSLGGFIREQIILCFAEELKLFLERYI